MNKHEIKLLKYYHVCDIKQTEWDQQQSDIAEEKMNEFEGPQQKLCKIRLNKKRIFKKENQ